LKLSPAYNLEFPLFLGRGGIRTGKKRIGGYLRHVPHDGRFHGESRGKFVSFLNRSRRKKKIARSDEFHQGRRLTWRRARKEKAAAKLKSWRQKRGAGLTSNGRRRQIVVVEFGAMVAWFNTLTGRVKNPNRSSLGKSHNLTPERAVGSDSSNDSCRRGFIQARGLRRQLTA